MSWNHKTRIVAMAVAIQSGAGVWATPSSSDLIAVAPPTNGNDLVSTEDPTASGSVWQQPRIKLSKNSNMGSTAPLRGPGGTAPFAANAWPLGRVLQAAGMAEVHTATAITANTQTGNTTTTLKLASGASATSDIYLGMPIQHAAIGSGQIKGTSLIESYNGTSKVAVLAETLGVAAGDTTEYIIPPNVTWQLGTLASNPPLLSVSIWRDKKRYNYIDVRVSALNFDLPVANDQSQTFPSIEFQLRGLPYSVAPTVDESTPPLDVSALPAVPPYRNGKFRLNKVHLGHASTRLAIGFENAAASNADEVLGQDAFEIMSGTRQIDFDINQMNITDFDIDALEESETVISTMSLWGMGPGNRFGFLVPALVLDPQNPGDRNGFVNLSGSGWPNKVDKGVTLTIWWDPA